MCVIMSAREQMCVQCILDVWSVLPHRDGDRQVSEQHHFVIKIMSGPIRVGTVIAGTRCVPAGRPWIRLSLPLPWQCLISSNHRKHFSVLLCRRPRQKMWKGSGQCCALSCICVSELCTRGELMDELRSRLGPVGQW